MVPKSNKKVLNATLTAAIWLYNVDLSEEILELGIKKSIFRSLENLGHKIPIFF